MGTLKEVPNPGLVKPESRDQIQARNREAAKALWAGKLTAAELAGVNAVCEAYGLDPLLKHILVLGGNLYVTVAGLRTWAYKQDDKPVSIQVCPATPEEKHNAGCPESSHYWKAMVWKSDTPPDRPFTEYGESDKDNVSLHRAGWKEIQDMAKTRAIGRALRNAYPVSLPLAEDMPMFPYDGAVIETTATQTEAVKEQAATQEQAGQMTEQAQTEQPPAPPQRQPPDGPAISEPQSKRLYAIAMRAGRTTDGIHQVLARWGYEHSKDIRRADYEAICREIESPPQERTPGEEG